MAKWHLQRSDLYIFIVILLAAVIYSSFSWGLPQRFNSPDELSNAYFSLRLARGESLPVPAPLNQLAQNELVHPRSMNVVQGNLVPASFIGLPLIYGNIARVVGEWSLPYLTIMFGIIGLWCLYFFVKELFDKRAAVIFILLTVSLPAFWYYHARAFFHNALFFDLLCILLWLSLKIVRQKKLWQYLLAGIIFGLLVSVRTSEIFWLTAAGLVWVVWQRRDLKLWPLIGGWLTAVASFVPVLYMNNLMYGSYFTVGYRSGIDFPGQNLPQVLSLVPELILPFGFHPNVIWLNMQNYLIYLQWWWAAVAFAGLVFVCLLWLRLSKIQRSYFVVGIIASIWLVVVYGSWLFHDNPDPQAVTLGTSYIRYWLPIYVFGLLPAALLLAWLWDKFWSKWLTVGVLVIFLIMSGYLVMYDSEEGLLKIKQNVIRFDQTGQLVQSLTPDDSVIVSGITDKFFFPERQVIFDLYNDQDYRSLNNLLQAEVIVYNFHSTWPELDLEYYNQSKIKQYNLKLEPVKLNIGEHSLYQYQLLKL